MRTKAVVLAVAAAVTLAAGIATGRQISVRTTTAKLAAHDNAVSTAVRIAFESQLGELAASLDTLSTALAANDRAGAQRAFRTARAAYKRSECLLAIYSPPTSSFLNGPPPESDGDLPPPPLGAPAGFQQIAALLYSDGGSHAGAAPIAALHTIADSMRAQTRTFLALTPLVTVADAALLDAVRAEVARVSTLGIAGFDTDSPLDASLEAAAALDGAATLARVAAARASGTGLEHAWNEAVGALQRAATQLRSDPGFERTARLTFIVRYVNGAARALDGVRLALPPSQFALRRVWRLASSSVFDSAAFDQSAYAPEFAPPASLELASLGKRLFSDPILSGPKTRSCASCHDPARAFTDGLSRARTLTPEAQGTARNTPTLINAALEPTQFADQRAGSLEEQVARVLSSSAEMQSSAALAASRLQEDSSYRAQFARALPGRRDTAVTALGVRIALAAYMRTLVALNSRFDRAARGDTAALTPGERRGFELFVGKARCASCHFMPLFTGVAPPDFVTEEPEIIGVPRDAGARRLALDGDPGREGVDHITNHRFAFKVPGLRNIALTSPYMHNGVFKSLDEVVEFYNRGGGAGSGLRVPNQTLSEKPLLLQPAERRDLVAFMQALTDTVVARVP